MKIASKEERGNLRSWKRRIQLVYDLQVSFNATYLVCFVPQASVFGNNANKEIEQNNCAAFSGIGLAHVVPNNQNCSKM